MLTRRRFLQGMATATVLGAPLATLPTFAYATKHGTAVAGKVTGGVSRYVDVFVGSGGHGHTFPGATLPFGMVQLSPDTYNAQWDGSSGYHQGDGSIMGFSHTHLSGTGAADLLDVLVMPAMGPVLLQPGDRDYDGVNYESRFDAKHAAAGTAPKAYKTHIKGYRSHYDGE
jgi:putative alpha-1,2-mannosidase